MVNTLEALYVITALALLVSVIQLFRGQRISARRLAITGAVGIVASIFLYWILSSSG